MDVDAHRLDFSSKGLDVYRVFPNQDAEDKRTELCELKWGLRDGFREACILLGGLRRLPANILFNRKVWVPRFYSLFRPSFYIRDQLKRIQSLDLFRRLAETENLAGIVFILDIFVFELRALYALKLMLSMTSEEFQSLGQPEDKEDKLKGVLRRVYLLTLQDLVIEAIEFYNDNAVDADMMKECYFPYLTEPEAEGETVPLNSYFEIVRPFYDLYLKRSSLGSMTRYLQTRSPIPETDALNDLAYILPSSIFNGLDQAIYFKAVRSRDSCCVVL
jgi:hypothetical protein